MKFTPPTTSPRNQAIFVFLIVLMAGVIYAPLTFGREFILGDGGMFYVMTEELRDNQWALPLFTSYNGGEIPFVYPPLGFYVAGLTTTFTNWLLEDVFRLLPFLFNLLALTVFYLFSRCISGSVLVALTATVIMAMAAPNIYWRLMGGGITRSLGYLFSTLVIYHALLLYTTGKRRYCLTTALFAALMILSHALAASVTVISVAVLFLFYGLNRRGVINSVITAVLVPVLIAPWLFPVLSQHGLETLLNPFQQTTSIITQWRSMLLEWEHLLGEPGLQLVSVFALLGMIKYLSDRRFFVPVWLMAFALLGHSRSYIGLVHYPLALAAAEYLINGLAPLILKEKPSLVRRYFVFLIATVIGLQIIIQGLEITLTIPYVNAAELNAMEWVSEHTPPDASFLVISPGSSESSDFLAEWFPALTQRKSVLTPQGREWLPDFSQVSQLQSDVRACRSESCVRQVFEAQGMNFMVDYIMFGAEKTAHDYSPLHAEFMRSPNFDIMYQDGGVVILSRNEK
jgi:hypothetical protein